jgi:site-specific DNA recombinase
MILDIASGSSGQCGRRPPANASTVRFCQARTRHPSLLTGLLFDDKGDRLTPTYSTKKGTRYRYYVSMGLVTGAKMGCSNSVRLPAGNLEGLVIDRLRAFLDDPTALLDALTDELHTGLGGTELIKRSRQLAEEVQAKAPTVVKILLMRLLCRVNIKPDRIEISLSRHRLAAMLTEQAIDQTVEDPELKPDAHDIVTLAVPARLKRVGREMRMLVDTADHRTTANASLLRIIVRAHDIQTRLIHNSELTVHDIAREERVSSAYIYTLLRLPWLAPDITAAIVNGRQPQHLNAMTLMRRASRLPADWAEQRIIFGFR